MTDELSSDAHSEPWDSFDIQRISKIPSPEEFPGVSERLDRELFTRFFNTLSQADQVVVQKYGLAPPDKEKATEVNNKLELFLLDQAMVLGYRLFLSRCFLQCLLQWWEETQEGPKRLEELGAKLSLGARIVRGEAKAPVEPAHYEFRQDLKSEIAILQKYLVAALRTRRQRNPEDLLADAEQAVNSGIAGHLPCLKQNWTAFAAFLRTHPEYLTGLFSPTKYTTPARIVNEFIGFSTNRDTESMRIETSRQGSKKHSAR